MTTIDSRIHRQIHAQIAANQTLALIHRILGRSRKRSLPMSEVVESIRLKRATRGVQAPAQLPDYHKTHTLIPAAWLRSASAVTMEYL